MSGPVLVFDSGVGGLSVAAAIRRQLPGIGLTYACDNAMLPYGTKPDAWLVTRIADVCCAAVEASRAAVLVVACNTASTLALRELRERLAIPVVGTVPAIKPAAAASHSASFGVLATSATLARPYTEALIAEFAAHCRVQRVAADALVVQAERAARGERVDMELLSRVLAPFWAEAALDTVVLGCTHFPLLKEHLSICAPRPVAWIDSGEAIARRVASVMQDVEQSGETPEPAWATAPTPGLAQALLGHNFAWPQMLLCRASLPV